MCATSIARVQTAAMLVPEPKPLRHHRAGPPGAIEPLPKPFEEVTAVIGTG